VSAGFHPLWIEKILQPELGCFGREIFNVAMEIVSFQEIECMEWAVSLTLILRGEGL